MARSERVTRQWQAGAESVSIFSTPILAAQPGGTASIGEVVNTDLETEIKNLYVCDTSIIPEPWGLPQASNHVLACSAKELSAILLYPYRSRSCCSRYPTDVHNSLDIRQNGLSPISSSPDRGRQVLRRIR
ncbi:hypothetical protein FDZ71_06355 [bacterium]|nr:MAG: hypothetical protein FDZ71_06355 [bacterium]